MGKSILTSEKVAGSCIVIEFNGWAGGSGGMGAGGGICCGRA